MNLLQAFDATRLQRIQQAAFKHRICLLFALPVNGVVAVGKPIQESVRPVVGIMLGKGLYTLRVHRVRSPLLTVRGFEFEVVSDTHELNAIGSEFPLGILLVPNGPHLPVIVAAYGFLRHPNRNSFFEQQFISS